VAAIPVTVREFGVDAGGYALRNAHAFVRSRPTAWTGDYDHAVFVLKETPYRIRREMPQLRQFGHGKVALAIGRYWEGQTQHNPPTFQPERETLRSSKTEGPVLSWAAQTENAAYDFKRGVSFSLAIYARKVALIVSGPRYWCLKCRTQVVSVGESCGGAAFKDRAEVV
jgi:hypothetical protein